MEGQNWQNLPMARAKMSAYEDDASAVCPKCRVTFDVHEVLSPECSEDVSVDPLRGVADLLAERDAALARVKELEEALLNLRLESEPDGSDPCWCANSAFPGEPHQAPCRVARALLNILEGR